MTVKFPNLSEIKILNNISFGVNQQNIPTFRCF